MRQGQLPQQVIGQRLAFGHALGGAAVVVETGGADHGARAVLDAGLQVLERAFGAGEVDQAVGLGQRSEVIGEEHARLLAERCAGILAHGGGDLAVQRNRQLQAGGLEDGIDQHLAHTAAGAGNCNTHVKES
ncbi:hypothetical protein G6F60_014902 [Rhizopus arrhizus]|nr:hypothetical protein G6F60_014902 [Rhizopus arrhizus]